MGDGGLILVKNMIDPSCVCVESDAAGLVRKFQFWKDGFTVEGAQVWRRHPSNCMTAFKSQYDQLLWRPHNGVTPSISRYHKELLILGA